MPNDWYYIIDGDTQQGPVSKDQIESMLSSGDLKPEMFICSPSVPQWTKAEDIDELKWERPFVPPPFATAKSKESAEDVAIPGKGDQPSTKVKTTEQDRWLEAIALSRTDEYLKDYMPVDSNDHTTIEQIRDAKIDGRMWKGHWYVLRPKMDGTTAGQSLPSSTDDALPDFLKDYMPVDSNDHTTIEQIHAAKIDGRMWNGQWYALRPEMGGTTVSQSLPSPTDDALPDFPKDYAGFWKRVAAHIIDSIILLFASVVFGFIFALSRVGSRNFDYPMEDLAVAENMGRILGFFAWWIYSAVMESSSTQGTLGKMAIGIKVTDLEGGKISFGRASGRHFGKYISALILSMGFIMAAFTQKKQGLHDKMASCLVVNK